ncbi:MAG: T9SS type A sorting domain-containing protein, partial [Chitinophagaceae bacterium]
MRYILSFVFAFSYFGSFAQWNSNASVNNAICNFTGNQTNVQVVSDSAGGAIFTWIDTRNGTQDIYAQRINASGDLQWPVDGVIICAAISDQFAPKLTVDGSGGAIITWYDNRSGNYDIYAQRINAAGAVEWTADGVAVCIVAGNQNAQQLISDNAGGAIIVWSDGRVGGPDADIYAQHINGSGALLWNAGGAAVSTASSLQNGPQLVSDGAGGAIVAWEDWRNFSQTDIYAQRISSNGFTAWTFNGVVICSEGNFGHQYNTRITSDGNGGAIMCWLDNRNFGSNTDIYAQKVNATGIAQWTANGIPVCTASSLQLSQQIITDGSGGAVITWEDRRSGRDIYAQRINTAGAVQWAVNGIVICSASNTQEEPQLAAGTPGNSIIIWTDSRNGSQDIYAQGINAAGTASWIAGGVQVANESQIQSTAQLITDGAGGAIIAWQDTRSITTYDIYSSRLFANGTLPLQLLSFSATELNGDVLLAWETDNEINTSRFDIEFSTNGVSFTKLSEITARNLPGRNQYRFTHVAPADNILFYRLKQIDIDGKSEHSNTVKVIMNRTLQLTVYPNPAAGFIQIKNIRPEEIQNIQVISSDGRVVIISNAN